MKISVNLVNKYLKNPLSTQQMAETLERTEVEVEEILYANQLDDKIIVAEVLSVKNHPNADKLKIADVDNGIEVVNIVCGAPNLLKGMKVALAQTGTTLPSGDVIGEAEIRGVKSHGMLCSAYELGWSDDHSGLVELDPSLPLGKSLCDIATNSDILDIKTPSNRWDYLSYIGLSREISACLTDNDVVEPEVHQHKYQNREVVKVKDQDSCKAIYSARISINNHVKTPKWLTDYLNDSGMRSVNAVVDITNFVMLEHGQPSHAYDAKKLKGQLAVRMAKSGERLTTLVGKTITLNPKDLLVVDNSGPVGLAGVMGGNKTETDENTTEIMLEVANFDKTIVRRSAMRHGLRTEASSRFERGLPVPLPLYAMNRLISLIEEICEGKLLDPPTAQINLQDKNIGLLGMRIRRAEQFLGYKIDEKEIVALLSKRGFVPRHFSFTKEIRQLSGAGFEKDPDLPQIIYAKAGILFRDLSDMLTRGMEVPKNSLKTGDLIFVQNKANKVTESYVYTGNRKIIIWNEKKKICELKTISSFAGANYVARRYVNNFNHIISVEIPWWRNDISSEVDLFEELAKSIGYDSMPETLPNLPPSATTQHSLLPSLMELRTMLVGTGANEVMTYSFVSAKDLTDTLVNPAGCLQIENPLSSEQDYLRSSMLASHLRVVAKNQSYDASAFYEVSRVYKKVGKTASESWKLGLAVCGSDSLLRLKGLIDIILEIYKIDAGFRRNPNNKLFIANRSAEITSGFGSFGQVDFTILSNFDVQTEVSWAELDIEEILNNAKKIKAREPVPYMLVRKEITVEVDDYSTFSDLKQKLKNLVREVVFRSEFSNEELRKKSRKRITISLIMDMGPNPKGQEISNTLDEACKKVSEIAKAQVL